MKKVLVFLCAIAVVLCFGTPSQATVLTFDDIGTGSYGTIVDGYGGFDWDQMGYIRDDYHPGSGYDNGVVSGRYTAYNRWANVATVSDSLFTFAGAYLTAAWNTGLNITVTGYLDGSSIFASTVVVDTTGPTWFDFNYAGIDRLTFDSFGGTDADYYDGGSGEHFAMDDFTYNPVPEPATLLLLGTGLLGLAGARRKMK